MLLMLLACWNVGTDDDDFGTVPFESDYAATRNGVVETLTTSLECPDGKPARFYLVYAPDWGEARPVAIVLHSSAFDYVVTPDASEPLAGQHWAGVAGYSRLERGWGIQKVWETLGMLSAVDPAEENWGTMPAAILDAGMVGVYPINCWGDLWHNESGLLPNDEAAEYFPRNGGAFANWMHRYVTEPEFASGQGFVSGALMDPEQITLVGLGDGARGATELMLREPSGVVGLVLDSPVDDLQHWQEEVPGVETGLARLYYDETDLLAWSVKRQLNTRDTLDGVNLALAHSSFDPKVPSGNLDGTLSSITASGASACVVDTEAAAHVQSNSDYELAAALVAFAATGEATGACAED